MAWQRGWAMFIYIHPPPRASNGDPVGDARQANMPWGTFGLNAGRMRLGVWGGGAE